MNVLVITGSPRAHGTSATLADAFIRGAEEAGHKVDRFDAAFKTVHPCSGCPQCNAGGKGCIHHDDMDELYPLLKEADVIVLASPVYFCSFSGYLKSVIDRFYILDQQLHDIDKAVLLCTMTVTDPFMPTGIRASFESLCHYLEWDLYGTVIAQGVPDVEALAKTDYAQRAYELGRRLA